MYIGIIILQAPSDGHILLAESLPFPSGNTGPKITEIAIGGWGNSKSGLRLDFLASLAVPTTYEVPTAGLLNVNEYRPFWISWKNGLIQFGKGMKVLLLYYFYPLGDRGRLTGYCHWQHGDLEVDRCPQIPAGNDSIFDKILTIPIHCSA